MNPFAKCSILVIGMLPLACLVVLGAGCRRSDKACEELRSEIESPYWPKRDADPAFCRRELTTIRRYAGQLDLSPARWYVEVTGQSVYLLNRVENAVALVETSKPMPVFSLYPSVVPCSPGVETDEIGWKGTPLGKLGLHRPTRLYFSFEVLADDPAAAAPVMTFRAWQDLNCDGKEAVTEKVGSLSRGQGFVFGKTWRQLSSREPTSITE